MPYSRSTTIAAKRKSVPFSSRKVGLAFLIITSSALVIMMLTDWLAGRGYFALKEVTILGNQFVRAAEIEDLTKLTGVQNVLYLNTEAIEDLLTSHPLIEEAQVTRRLPSSLTVAIVERQPLALLNTTRLTPIDAAGSLIKDYRAEMLHDYPIISNIRLKDQSFELKTILDFLQYVKNREFALYSEISEISYSDEVGIYFRLIKGASVFWGQLEKQDKIENLRLVLRKALMQDSTLSNIENFDVRFKNQVVVKQKNT